MDEDGGIKYGIGNEVAVPYLPKILSMANEGFLFQATLSFPYLLRPSSRCGPLSTM
jgi:hypothetical protein